MDAHGASGSSRDRRRNHHRGGGGNLLYEPRPSDSTEIAGYIFDPVRKRYFRSEVHAPDNNFTKPIHEILEQHAKETEARRETWVHPCVLHSYSPLSFLNNMEVTSRSGSARRKVCAAFQVSRDET